MVDKNCPVKRAAYSYTVMQSVPGPSSIASGKLMSGPPQIQQQVMQVWAQHHELRTYGDPRDYEMYCVFCGQISMQSQWATAMQEQKSVGS